MFFPESKYFKYNDFLLSDRNIIQDLTIAYQTWGELNQKKDNAILIFMVIQTIISHLIKK